MNAQTPTITTITTTVTSKARSVRSDTECHARAHEFLTELIGSPPDSMSWDGVHRLQGHSQVQGCELVVIAPRDDDHDTVVLTAEDWDAVRRSSSGRRELIEEYAIIDHDRLVAVLHHRYHWSAPFIAAA